jgi:adenylate cyclase, class 2
MLYPAELRALRLIVSLNVSPDMIETEVKIRFERGADDARGLIENRGYVLLQPRTLESDQVFDRGVDELRAADQLLRLRRSGACATVTYKGPANRERYKSREEIEFDVSDPDTFELVLNRLGYTPRFRYEKFRTKFAAAGEHGVITIDETPIGVFLELEGEAGWIDQTAARLGLEPSEYCTHSYAALYREYLRLHPGAPSDMVFNPQ